MSRSIQAARRHRAKELLRLSKKRTLTADEHHELDMLNKQHAFDRRHRMTPRRPHKSVGGWFRRIRDQVFGRDAVVEEGSSDE